MSKSVFISVVHQDAHLISNLTSWATKGLLGPNATITHETQDKRPEGREAIRNHLRKKIEGASVIIVLIGRDTHNHDWITVEVELANSFHKKLIPVRIPGTTGAVPPILRNHSLVSFDPNSIKNQL